MTSLKYPDAVGEARMLQLAQKDASPEVEPPITGFEISLGRLRRVHGDGEGRFPDRPDSSDLYYDKVRTVFYDWR
ncbi:hypothetical protein EO776_15730 (plasmid) [Halorubrum ezzemoulense]|uniref:Uncharacterized protein n=1 Tax=Halorubrum ezzemoulense TaxID=337243 RepID=A0A481RJQ8_HALEZ|nr:hypothetical protein EO776_15730 [Halorubrum ezzemoulense]